MKKRFNKFLTLLAVLLLGFGQMWGAEPIENVGTYSTQVISADGKTSTWTFPLPSSQITLPTGETEENDIIYAPSGSSKMKFSSGNQFSWSGVSSGYFYVPSDGEGTITMTVKSSSDSRYLQLFVDGSAAADSKRLWSKYNATPTSDGKKGPQSFSFTSDDLTTKGTKTYLHFKDNNTEMKIATISVTLTKGSYISGGCSAPDAPTISGTTSYTEGQTIELTASCASGADASTTYTWYEGADWATASAASPVQAAAVAGDGGNVFTKTAALADNGKIYWCEAANSTCVAHSVAGTEIAVAASAAAKHDITYTNTKGADNSANPTQYTEGIGVASFEPLADVTDFHFTGWSPASIANDATTDQTIDAQWVAAYNVTFNAGVGSGTVPASFQKWEGGKFNLPGQGSMTHATKVFDGWKANGAGDKLAADAEYTMGNAAVEFVAQWKAAPVTIFHWKSNTGTITIDAANGTTTGGTTTLRTTDPSKSWGNESVTYNASVAADMKGETSGKELKPGGNANYLELTLTSGTFQEGDVIYVTGYNNWAFLTSAEGISSATSFDVANVETGSGKGDAVTGSATIPAGIDAATIYARRANASSSGIAAIKVTRIVKDIISTVNTLTDVKVGESSISAANLATLVSEHSLALSDALASAPTITFNQHTVITYEDYSTKTTDTPIPVVASDNGAGKWTASATIDAVTYTVTLDIATGFAVTYNANGGSGTMTDATLYAEGDEVTVLENTFTSPAANKKFNGWTSSPSVTITDGKFTMPSSAVELSAVWTEFFTVTYMDGTDELDTEDVFVGSTPAGIAPTKPLFTFAGWKNASDEDVDLVTVDAATTLYAKWDKAYASSVDLEGLVEASGTGADWQAYMSSHNFAFSTSNVSLDAKASGKTYENWPYQGLKAKEVGAYVEGRINANKLVIIKLGHMAAAANVSLDGVAAGTATGLDAAEPAGQLNYFYVENESVLRYETTNGGACVLKAITITNPFQVTFNANGGDPVASQYGHPAVTLPDASNGTKSLLGWFDAAEGGNKIGDVGESYTPAADIELFAQWEDVSTDARLASITFSSAAGTLSPAFDPEIVNYTYTMPYPTAAVPTITGATSVSAKAQDPEIVSQAAAWNETAVIRGVAESGDKKTYNITMKIAPKDGVSIIKVATTGGTNKTVTGLYASDGDVNLSSSTKMDGGKYIGFSLDGTTLQAGDRINVHTTTAANTGGSHIIFYDNMTDKNELYDTEEIGGTGDNIFEINAAMVGSATAYVYRANNDAVHQWNGYVDFIEVTRAMNPVLTAITIDGRDGEIDALDDKHFSVTIPYEADLAALTVVPTIVRNAVHPTTPEAVISNEGAWILGDNTYRIMDKDGDYTDYTITLDRDVLKHTVSFNTHGGTAIDPVLVAHGEYLAAAPSDPEKEDYIFQHWSLSDGGAAVDVTTVQINEDKEFHAVWVADGAIKLLDGSTVNHTNFITAVTADETVEFQGNTVNYAKFSGTCSGVNSVKDLTRVIAYNATTNKTKIRISAHNNSTSARSILVKGLVEGASAAEDLATIALANKEDKVSDWIEFDNAANRTIYIMVSSSAGDVYFTQVKVVESGETPMKQAGEAGYSLNLNKGRAFGKADDDVVFEGLNIELIGDYTALNSGNLKMNSSSISFAVAAPVTLNVTTANSKTYYVANSASGTDNETAFAGVSEFNLTAGTWFINAGDADVQLTNIAFSAPKCEKPVFTSLADIELCEGDPFTAFNGSATVSDGGTVTYQWYNEDDSEISGAIAATYTPSADGKYYVIATNSLAGFADNFAKSDLVTVQHVASAVITEAPKSVRKDAGEEATLTVAASGKNLSYEWFTCNEDGTGAVAIVPAETNASLTVTVPSGTQWYKVVVSSDCGNAEAIAKVEEWTELPQLDVTASMTWDWTYAGENNKLVTGKNVEIVMANIRENDKIPTNDATFRSQALLFYGENVRATEGGRNYASIGHIAFHTTVPGVVIVEFSDNGSNNRRVSINGKLSEASAAKTDVKTFSANVPAGDVTIMGVEEDGSGSNKYIRISKIEFVKVDYTRPVTAGRLGTICLPNGGKMYGAGLYEIAYFDATAKKIFFDEIINGEMIAGRPYIFLPNEGVDLLAVAYTDNADADAGNYKGLYGSYTQEELGTDGSNYILLNNQYCRVVEAHTYVGANRAYIKLGEIGTTPYAAAPGRRRISMGVTGENQAQGFENLQSGDQPMKVMIDGTLYIIRGEKVFDATGRLVK